MKNVFQLKTWVQGETGVDLYETEEIALLAGMDAILCWLEDDISVGDISPTDGLRLIAMMEEERYKDTLYLYNDLMYSHDTEISLDRVWIQTTAPEVNSQDFQELREFIADVVADANNDDIPEEEAEEDDED